LATDFALGGAGGDVQSVAEYAHEIHDQLFLKEVSFLPRPDYMDSQADINGRMRSILIDWLIEVHMKYRLRPETLFLTVNILDRYLSSVPVARKSLQLVGVVSMLIASKFEEISPPEVHDFVYITDSAYTKEDIMTYECAMLTALSFQVVAPTPLNFLERLQRTNGCDEAHRELAQYLVELALLDIRMVGYLPSHLAAAAVLLSNVLLGRRSRWPAVMVQDSRYQEIALRACAEEMRALLELAPSATLQAVRKKYSLAQHHAVARMAFGAL
jgi:cyclin B